MHPIKRGVLVVLLSLGAIGGFTHGFAYMAQCHGSCEASRRDQFEDHIADVCTRAAQRQWDANEAERAEHHHHHGDWGGPQWGGPQWGPPPAYWGAPPAPPAAPPAAPTAEDTTAAE
jgi:hypothetical protein